MPVRDGDEYIGFQSKYYDASTKLSDRVDELKEALKGEDINLIKSKQEALQAKFYEISEKLYKAASGAQGFDPNAAQGFDPTAAQGGTDENGYYEAPFTDVNE